MARIAGVNIPENKHLEIALTHIYGIGKKTAQDICTSVKLDYSKKVSDLSEEQIETIRTAVAEYTVEGDLRRSVSTNIKEPYKGKGVKYADENIRRKEAKKAAGA